MGDTNLGNCEGILSIRLFSLSDQAIYLALSLALSLATYFWLALSLTLYFDGTLCSLEYPQSLRNPSPSGQKRPSHWGWGIAGQYLA